MEVREMSFAFMFYFYLSLDFVPIVFHDCPFVIYLH